jgi:ribosome-associated heat shock protein Hsp15
VTTAEDGGTRLDRWLWYARFFKTRPLARRAVDGGRVHVAGARVKPGRQLKIGDVLDIQRGHERFEVTVAQLGRRRGPASEAQQLYLESEASRTRRAAEAAQRRAEAASAAIPRSGRPSKRDRRRIRSFREGSE